MTDLDKLFLGVVEREVADCKGGLIKPTLVRSARGVMPRGRPCETNRILLSSESEVGRSLRLLRTTWWVGVD